MVKFHGLSTPDQLKKAWKNLTDLDENTLNIVWDYEPNKHGLKQLKQGCNIINSRYDPNNPNEIGHYCAIFLTPTDLIYYNPIGGVMIKTCYEMAEDSKLKKAILKNNDMTKEQLVNYPIDNALIETTRVKPNNIHFDLTGEQRINSNSCGFYCLARLYDYITNPKKYLEDESTQSGSLSFKKLSTPDELQTAWENLMEDAPPLNVVYDFKDIKQLINGCNIINEKPPNQPAHYCAVFKTPKKIIYYNPIFSVMLHTCYEETENPDEKKLLTKKYNIKKIKTYPIDNALLKIANQAKYQNIQMFYDMTGGEKKNSLTSDFYCLMKLYDILNYPLNN